MKKLIYILFVLSLNSCSNIIGQKQDDEFKKDQELNGSQEVFQGDIPIFNSTFVLT